MDALARPRTKQPPYLEQRRKVAVDNKFGIVDLGR